MLFVFCIRGITYLSYEDAGHDLSIDIFFGYMRLGAGLVVLIGSVIRVIFFNSEVTTGSQISLLASGWFLGLSEIGNFFLSSDDLVFSDGLRFFSYYFLFFSRERSTSCLLYTSDAADE